MRDLAAADCEHGQVALLRMSGNHMDPCFRLTQHELLELFEKSTVTEVTQVKFATGSTTGLWKFRRNSRLRKTCSVSPSD